MRIRYTQWLGLIAVLAAIAIYIAADNRHFPIDQGLDLAGGIRVVLQLQPTTEVQHITQDTQSQVVQVIENRVNTLGVSEPVIQPKGNDQVVVEISENRAEKGKPLDKRAAIQTLLKTAKLEFIYLANVESKAHPLEPYKLTGVNTFMDKRNGHVLTDAEVAKQILYNDPRNLILTGRDLVPGQAQASWDEQGNEPETLLKLDSEGADKFREFTAAHVNDFMAIVYDGKVESAPNIETEIPNGDVRITHGQGATLQDAVQQANLLNSGALPVPLKIVQLTEVEPTLGADSIRSMKVAGLTGIGLVLVFMALYYLLPGILADAALLFYALLTFAIFKLLHVTMSLPGLAGFILSIGMAVDANILIFERTKEELRSGKPLHAAIDAGFKRAWPSIFDSNMSTWLTCLVLGWYGTGPIRGFALTLAIGVGVSMFTAITVTRALLHVVVNQPWAQDPRKFGLRREWLALQGEDRHMNIIGRRNLWFGLSLAVIVPGLIFLVMGGLKPGIDFTRGSLTHYEFSKPVTTQQVRSAVSAAGIKDAAVQMATSQGKLDSFVRTPELNNAERDRMLASLQKLDPGARVLSFDTVGAAISHELTRNAFLSVLMASIIIILFLTIRFGSGGGLSGLKYGVCAVIALLHDVFVVVGLFAIFGMLLGWQIDSLFVTALLTVIGFSVHDTIVIFDRIRENLRTRGRDDTFESVVNRSVNQTLSRSINTSFTVVLTLGSLLFLGGPVIRVFVAAMFFGVISGTYSSIFNASPLVVVWEQMATKKRQAAASRPRTTQDVRLVDNKPRPRPAATPKAPAPRPVSPVLPDGGEGATGGNAPQPPVTAGAGDSVSKPRVQTKRKKRF